ncbi:carbohydrate ABC transporter permease [Aidingimonas halophila]|uniref:Carbohydrate ABC transporter membrane protein 2, CUT1 family n=1 Tax=Aidingimonas halophila TaxID=574349 RepID=A0A1H2S4F1_9GAMM|nr:carbohydrate ABC transporter permease [Aidingimonas halophila]GHC18246.1 sugar ABC transporter permease [Aidingimonas halophila]SDW26572.1 carbohydrate ABC transporter membrane protein 2, CUT1 family [Aidingimonas halophila]
MSDIRNPLVTTGSPNANASNRRGLSHYQKGRLLLGGQYAGLTLWLIVSLLPPVILLAAAFNETAMFRSPLALLTMSEFTLANFTTAFRAGDFWFYFRNSLIISVAAVIISVVVCVPMAYGLNKLRPRIRSGLSFAVLAMRFLPHVVLALPLFLIFVNIGLTGSRLGLLLAHLAIHIPFAVWMMVGFFENVPKEMEEAAIVDGCGPWKLFWTISLPVVRPGLNALAILVFIMSWNEYLFALFLAGSDAQPLTVGITRFMGGVEAGAQYGVIAAYASLIVLPVIFFALVANRYIVSGMTAGAVKG